MSSFQECCSLTSNWYDASRQMLQEWLKKNPNALVKDMQHFIEAHCGLKVSCETISRHLRRDLGHPPRAKAWERRKVEKPSASQGGQGHVGTNSEGDGDDDGIV